MICNECGRAIGMNDCRIVDGRTVCNDCFDELYFECAECGEIHPIYFKRHIKDEDRDICRDCYENGDYFRCDDCGKYYSTDYGNTYIDSDDKVICEDCLEESYEQCEWCREWYKRSDMRMTHNSNYVCEICYESHYDYCNDCGRLYDRDDMYWSDADDCYYCENCWDCHFDSIIYDYHEYEEFSPRRMPIEDHTNIFYGFELEVAGDRDCASDFLSYFDNTGDVVLMNDSSVDGFEIVSQPFSEKYFYEKFKPQLEAGLSYLKKHGFEGHNRGGLHIHVSQDAITDTMLAHLADILYGSDDDVDIWLAITQRRRNAMLDWCRMGEDFRDYCFDSLDDGNSWNIDDERHTALNYDDRTNTFEFRIFNSNLRIERILKNFECVLSLIEYVRLHRNTHYSCCNTKKFMEFVLENQDKYPNLNSFIKERQIYEKYGIGFTDEELEAA